MTTAVRPESGLDWAIEIPECVDRENDEYSSSGFNDVLYNVALAGRFGFIDVPKSLPLIEQALLATVHTMMDNLKHVHPDDPNANVQQYITNLGRTFYWYIRIAQAKPQVGHFVGNASGNENDADLWQHAGH